MRLTQVQQQALAQVRDSAFLVQKDSAQKINRLLSRTELPMAGLEQLTAIIRTYVRITVNFHPDRMLSSGISVIDGLLQEGQYHSQFRTGVSNGSRSAFPGGDRDIWELKLFGGAYHTPKGNQEERPKYGALNLMGYADGASPRFGSCFFVLAAPLLDRATFTFGDSHTGPEPKGTIDAFEPVLAALLETVEKTGNALGTPHTNVISLLRRLLTLDSIMKNTERMRIGRALDDYIEAQVHGAIALQSDVDELIADASYQNTPTGSRLEALSAKYSIRLRWHPGFELIADCVPEAFRGPAIPPFARRVAQHFAGRRPGLLDAEVLGRAAAERDDSWAGAEAPAEVYQYFKQLWHVLVQYGEPVAHP